MFNQRKVSNISTANSSHSEQPKPDSKSAAVGDTDTETIELSDEFLESVAGGLTIPRTDSINTHAYYLTPFG